MQIVNGRPRQETSVLLHLTGAAVEYADPSRGLKKSIGGVVKVKMLCGVLHSIRMFEFLPHSGG